MSNILYSFLGTQLDAHGNRGHHGPDRWSFWRPSVALAMQEDLHFDEYHIWYDARRFQTLFDGIARDIMTCSPDTAVIPEVMDLNDPWDFEEVYGKLYDFSRLQHLSRRRIGITSTSPLARTSRRFACSCSTSLIICPDS